MASCQHPAFRHAGRTHLVPQALTEGHVRVSVAAREHLPLGQLCPQGLATDHVCLGYIGHIPHAPGGTHTGVSEVGDPSPRLPRSTPEPLPLGHPTLRAARSTGFLVTTPQAGFPLSPAPKLGPFATGEALGECTGVFGP